MATRGLPGLPKLETFIEVRLGSFSEAEGEEFDQKLGLNTERLIP